MIRIVFALLLAGVSADRVCYPDLGCFNNLPPFLDVPDRPVSPLPESREDVGTEFVLNTPTNNFDFEYDIISNLVPGSLESSHFNPSLETKILVHGYGESGYSDWIKDMGRAFLTVGDYNIIRVDWFKGAFEFYPTATSNARLVGAEISLLMDNIATAYPNTLAANATNYHIVGYSLGAHVAGYAGERQPELARITGLDPSAPYFEDTATQVRLDETDAVFVDVIHTDTDPRKQRGYGMYYPCGHMDFYPNGGTEQPGCDSSITEYLPLDNVGEGGIFFVPCNHRRAFEIFTETILKNGAKPCGAFPTSTSNVTSFYYEVFDSLPAAVEMGIQSVSYKPVGEVNVIYQRRTTENTAYGFQYRVTITFADPGRNADTAVGELFLTINGDQSTIYRTKLDETGHYEPGGTYTFYIFTEDYPGNILYVGFSWIYDRDWYKPWTWPVFSTPDVYIENIQLELLEDSSRYTFCGDGDKYKANEEEDRDLHLC